MYSVVRIRIAIRHVSSIYDGRSMPFKEENTVFRIVYAIACYFYKRNCIR